MSNTIYSVSNETQESYKMANKALISELTWRTLKMQKDAFPDMPHYIGPDELHALLRKTTRRERLYIHVVSLAVIADNEKDFRAFWKKCHTDRINLVIHEERLEYDPSCDAEGMVKDWRKARKHGAAKAGARNSADKKIANTKEAIAVIADRWPLPSKEWPTGALLEEAGISLNTAKAHLGKRPIAQYNYQAAQKRKERRNVKF